MSPPTANPSFLPPSLQSVVDELFSYHPSPQLSPPETLSPQPQLSRSELNTFRAGLAQGSIDETTCSSISSARSYTAATEMLPQLKFITIRYDEWPNLHLSDASSIQKHLSGIFRLLCSADMANGSVFHDVRNDTAIESSWVDCDHRMLNFGAVLDPMGRLGPNSDVSTAGDDANLGTINSSTVLLSLLGDLSGMIMGAVTSHSYQQFSQLRKEVFNTPTPGPTITRNPFHNAYEICEGLSSVRNFRPQKPFIECPLSYSMHIHLRPLPTSTREALVFDNLRKYTILEHLQVTVFHSAENFSYMPVGQPPTAEASPPALNILARVFNSVVNGRQHLPVEDSTSEERLLENQLAVFGGASNYDAFIMVESIREWRLFADYRRNVAFRQLSNQVARLEDEIISKFEPALRKECSNFFEYMQYAEDLSRQIIKVQHNDSRARPLLPPLPPSTTTSQTITGDHLLSSTLTLRPPLVHEPGPVYRADSPELDAPLTPSQKTPSSSDSESDRRASPNSTLPSTPTALVGGKKRKRGGASSGGGGGSFRKPPLTAEEKDARTQQIVDGILASYRDFCSLEDLQCLINDKSDVGSDAIDVRINVWHECESTMAGLPRGAALETANPSDVGDVFARLGSAIVALTTTSDKIQIRQQVWRLSAATLILESLKKLEQSDDHFRADSQPFSTGPGELVDPSTTAKIRRVIDHFFHQHQPRRFAGNENIHFELAPDDVLENPDKDFHAAVHLSGPASKLSKKTDTIAAQKVRLEKQVLFTMFLRNAIVHFSNATVGARCQSRTDPDFRAPANPSKPAKHRKASKPSNSRPAGDRLFFPKAANVHAKEVSKWSLFLEICSTIRQTSAHKPPLQSYFMIDSLFKVCFQPLYQLAFTPDVIARVCEQLRTPQYQDHNLLLAMYASCLFERAGGGIFPDGTSSLRELGISRHVIMARRSPVRHIVEFQIPCLQRFRLPDSVWVRAVNEFKLNPMEQKLFAGLYSCFLYGKHLNELFSLFRSTNYDVAESPAVTVGSGPLEQQLTSRAMQDSEVMEHIQPLRMCCPTFLRLKSHPAIEPLKSLENEGDQVRLLHTLCLWRACAPCDEQLFSRLIEAQDANTVAGLMRDSLSTNTFALDDFKLPMDDKFSVSRSLVHFLVEGLEELKGTCQSLNDEAYTFEALADRIQQVSELNGTPTMFTICFDAVEFELISPPLVSDLIDPLLEPDIFPSARHGIEILLENAELWNMGREALVDCLSSTFGRLVQALDALLPAQELPPFNAPDIRSLGVQDLLAAFSSISWQALHSCEDTEQVRSGDL